MAVKNNVESIRFAFASVRVCTSASIGLHYTAPFHNPVMGQILDANGLLLPHQSGLRKNHSTETLVKCLLSDLYRALGAGKISVLALFDVSSACDSVDHSILL